MEPSVHIEPQIMEYRPNSYPDNSAIIRAESPILSLPGHYVLNLDINCWDDPKYTTYSTKEADYVPSLSTGHMACNLHSTLSVKQVLT